MAGLVSWGSSECGHAQLPGVYTHIWEFKNWIAASKVYETEKSGAPPRNYFEEPDAIVSFID